MIAVLLVGVGCWAQPKSHVSLYGSDYDLHHFRGLVSQGPMPADLSMGLMELYKHDKQRVKDYTNKVFIDRDKVLESSYYIKRMLASGRIVYGDPVSQLASRIADTLLKDYPTLRGELRFYTVKSPAVNAFATGQGMVFICTGLISHLHNEAELAYVLSHEIVHYVNKHTLEVLTRKRDYSNDIEAETKELRDFIKFHNRSREMETEADNDGLKRFFLPSPYNDRAVSTLFDVLQYSQIPYISRALDTAYFNTPYFRLPSAYYKDSLDEVSVSDDDNDSLSTHPNIKKRRQQTAETMGEQHGGVDFLMITEEDFAQLQRLTREEDIRQMLIYGDYVNAFYHSYALLEGDPDNEFLAQSLCAALYGLSKFKSYANTRLRMDNYSTKQGEIQQCYHLFGKITPQYTAIVAAHKLYEYRQQYPANAQIAAMSDDLFVDLAKRYGLTAADFSKEYSRDSVAQQTESGNMSRLERLRAQQSSEVKSSTNNPVRYAFTDLMKNDSQFEQYLTAHVVYDSTERAPQSLKKSKQLVFSPMYIVYDSKREITNIRETNKLEERLYNDIRAAARRQKIESVDFTDHHLQEMTTAAQYNEWTTVTEWMTEVDQFAGQFDKVATMQPLMTPIAKRYNASSVNTSVVVNLEQLEVQRSAKMLLYGVWIPPIWPALLNYYLQGSENTYVQSSQYDAFTGQLLGQKSHFVTIEDERGVVRGNLYDMYHNLGSKKTKAPGYMRSKLVVAGNASLGVRLLSHHSLGSGEYSFPRSSMVNMQFGGEVEYVVAPHTSVLLTADYMPTSVEDYEQLYPFNRLQFNLMARSYTRNSLAPVGPYLGFGLSYGMMIPTADNTRSTERVAGYGIKIEMGRRYVVADHVLIGVGAQYSVLLSKGLFGLDNDIYNDNIGLGLLTESIMRVGVSIGLMP